MTLAEKHDAQRHLIHAAFCTRYLAIFSRISFDARVYEAPAAESWVVIVGEDAWVHIGGSDDQEFMFWGPLGKKSIAFDIPEGWPA